MSNKNEGFYKAFEDRFRGDRELIKSRLEVYLPFIDVVKRNNPQSNVIDLGCGRGEWLELLRDHGVIAQGVDINEGMLAECRERKLQVETADALGFLRTLGDESVSVVSAFHVVEHISFESLQDLVKEAYRVLCPSGLLILETPNPENIAVGTTNFYLDPTHIKPIPPQLLEFIPEHYGFFRSNVLRLQESKEMVENDVPTLMQVIASSSPDYSVIAQKKGSEIQMSSFGKLFDSQYGVSLATLCTRYDRHIFQRIATIESKFELMENSRLWRIFYLLHRIKLRIKRFMLK